MKHSPFKRVKTDYLRSMLFGFEDALVSTTGVVIGISAGTSNKGVVILAALVTIIVEALSMGAGEYLSEEAVRQLHRRSSSHEKESPTVAAGLMFMSYAFAGIIPVVPVFLFDFPMSAIGSGVLAFASLFLLGFVKGEIVGISAWKSGVKMLVVGGLAAVAGILVGLTLHI